MPRINIAASRSHRCLTGHSPVVRCPDARAIPARVPAPAGTITVSGKVISATQQPIASSPVVITGLPATVTDANGAFTIAGVTPPYDVTVVVSATKLGITYRGLTRSDPTLVNFLSSTPPPNSATVSGTVSGGAGFPQPATRTSAVLLTSTETSASATPNATTGAYSLTTTWTGATTLTTVLHALQWDKNAAGMPTAFTGYGEKTGVTHHSRRDICRPERRHDRGNRRDHHRTGHGTRRSHPPSKSMSLVFATKGTISLGSESGTATSFSYAVPVVTGTTLTVDATCIGRHRHVHSAEIRDRTGRHGRRSHHSLSTGTEPAGGCSDGRYHRHAVLVDTHRLNDLSFSVERSGKPA